MKTKLACNSPKMLKVGLCGIPLLIHATLAIVIVFATRVNGNSDNSIPAWAWHCAWLCLPVLSGLLGYALVRLLPQALSRLPQTANPEAAQAFSLCFIVAWNLVYGYLGFFTFAMGLYAEPKPIDLEQFLLRLASVLWQYPLTIIISLVVCFGLTAVAVVLSRLNARITPE